MKNTLWVAIASVFAPYLCECHIENADKVQPKLSIIRHLLCFQFSSCFTLVNMNLIFKQSHWPSSYSVSWQRGSASFPAVWAIGQSQGADAGLTALNTILHYHPTAHTDKPDSISRRHCLCLYCGQTLQTLPQGLRRGPGVYFVLFMPAKTNNVI